MNPSQPGERFLKVWFILRVLACALALAVAACSKPSPDQLVASAREALAKNDPKAAVVQLKAALQERSEDADARFLLGQALLETDDFPAAEKELRKAIDLGAARPAVDPWLAQALLRQGDFIGVVELASNAQPSDNRGKAMLLTAVGEAQIQLGHPEAAEGIFKSAVEADPTYSRANIGVARLRAASGDLDKALEITTAALATAPKEYEGWRLKGDILLAKRQLDEAAGAYRKAIEAKPDFVPAHSALIGVLLRQNKQEEAEKSLTAMQQVAPKNPQTVYAGALVAYGSGDLKRAHDAASLYSGIAPDDLRGALLAGEIDYRLHSYSSAESNLAKVVQRAPGYVYARRLLTATYLESGRPVLALQTLKPVLGAVDSDPALMGLAGEVFLRNGQADVAAKYFQKASVAQPDATPIKAGLALTHLAQGDLDRGYQELRSAAESDTSGISADLALIATLMRQQKYDDALAAIDRLEKKQPDKALPHNLRGLSLVGKKDTQRARQSFERALAIDPQFLPAALNLAAMDIKDNKPADAENRLRAIVDKNPANSQALLALAGLRERNYTRTPEEAKNKEVVDLINRAIAAAPTDANARLALVAHYLAIHDASKAIAAAQDADAAIPNSSEVLAALAQAQRAGNDANQALKTYGRLAQLRPESPEPLVRMAEIEVGNKNYDQAADLLRRALALRPDLVSAQRGLISVELDANHLQQAVSVAHEVQKQRPKEAVGYIFEGDIYAARKKWPESIAAYRLGMKQAPTSEVASRLYGALLASGSKAEAEKVASSWMAEHADDRRFRMYVAEAAITHGDAARAHKEYETLLAKDPNNPVLLNNLAWSAGKVNDPKAIEYAEKANQLAPNQALIMDTLGTLLVDKGDVTRGLELLRKAADSPGSPPAIRLSLSRALIKSGQKDAARKELTDLQALGDKYSDQAEVERLLSSL